MLKKELSNESGINFETEQVLNRCEVISILREVV